MNNFIFEKVSEVNETVKKLSSIPKAKPIGGGTNLLDLMKESVMAPDALIDINSLNLKDVHWEEDTLYVGALVTNSDLAYNTEVERSFPLLSQAILAGASPQIRNMATTGGNILQRTRCYYFYDVGTPCNKREPGSGCGALEGRNRIHAILGHSKHCIAVHPSDMAVALMTLDARVRVAGKNGIREIPFDEFHRLPEDTPHLDHNLKADELITHILIPRQKNHQNYSYLKIRDRASYSFALVSVAVSMRIEEGLIQEVALSLGGVAHRPWRDRELEETLTGRIPSTETFDTFARHLLADARGFADNSFKIDLTRRAIVKAMREASQRTVQ